MKLVIVTLTLGLLMSAPSYTQTHQAGAQAIRAIEAQWNLAFAAKDVDKIVAYYTDDAVLITTGEPPAQGKQAIRSAMTALAGDAAFSLTLAARRVEVAKSGDMAYSEGAYTLTVTNPATKSPVTDKGSYVTIYKKSPNGTWKAVEEVAVSGPIPTSPPSN